MTGAVGFTIYIFIGVGTYLGARADDAGFLGALFVAVFWPLAILIGIGKGLMR